MLLQSLACMRKNSTLPHIRDALDCLDMHRNDAPGRYEFSGGYLLLQEGDTKPMEEGDFEAHKKYLDVQILLEGTECVMWADIRDLTESVPYDEAKDKVMYSGDGTPMMLAAGNCYVCWPEDGHKACRHIDAQTHYRKAVVKLAL